MKEAILLATACIYGAVPAYAQDDAAVAAPTAVPSENGQLGEIIVSATKREQNLQRLFMSITAVTGDMIEGRALETLDQVTRYTPNVRIAGVDGPAKYISVRGLGSGNNRGFETSAGFFMDGVYLGLSFDGDVTYTAKYYTAGDLDPESLQSGFALLNGRMALSNTDQGWSLAVIGKNLANKAYSYVSANMFQFAGTLFNHVGQARQVDVQLRYKR